MKNIEIKARCADFQQSRSIAESLPAELAAEGEQTDTYFQSPQGRMKLRQSSFDDEAALIWYMRSDTPDPRPSEYRIAKVPKADKLLEFLSGHFGVEVVVKKNRSIYIYENVRINLDNVPDLGCFIEFEAPIEASEQEARDRVEELMNIFDLSADDLVPESYSDLVAQ